MKANGKRIKCMVKVHLSGVMENDMKVTLLMIREKAKVLSNGKMAVYTKVNGRTENSMVLEYSLQRIIK